MCHKVQLLKVSILKTTKSQSFAVYFNKHGQKPQTGSKTSNQVIFYPFKNTQNKKIGRIHTEPHDFTVYLRFHAILMGFCFDLGFYSRFRSFRVSKIVGFHDSTREFDNND
jgi:hypothetical protein